MGGVSYCVAIDGSRLLQGYGCMNNSKDVTGFVPVGIDLDDDACKEIRKEFSGSMKCVYSIGNEIHSLIFISRVEWDNRKCSLLAKRFGFHAFIYHEPSQIGVCLYDVDGRQLERFGSDDGFDKIDYLDAVVSMVEHNIGKSIEFKSLYEWIIDNSATSLVAHHFNDKFVTGWKTAICRYDGDSAMEEQS